MACYIIAFILVLNIPLLLHSASSLHNLFSRESSQMEDRSRGIHPRSQSMLIFLDDSENHIGSVTSNFAAALYQPFVSRYTPEYTIVASKSLLQSILIYKQLGKTAYDSAYEAMLLRTTKDIFYGGSRILLSSEKWFAIGSIIVMGWIQRFDYSDIWDVYVANERTVLLVPKNNTQAASGLHVSDLKLLDAYAVIKEILPKHDRDPSEYLQSVAYQRPKSADYIIDALPLVFKLNKSYTRESAAPQWIIYINGHGSAGRMVSGIPVTKFTKVLHFLENAIITRCLIISSCCATGINVEKVYGASTKQYFNQTYSFPIILEGVADVAIAGSIIGQVSFENDIPKPTLLRNYEAFGIIAKNTGPISYKELLSYIFLFKTENIDEHLIYASNFAQIRLANRHEFKAVFAAIEITPTMAKTRQQPLNINKAWHALRHAPVHSEIPYISLRTNYIPFMLDFSELKQIEDGPLCFINSALPGDVDHYLAAVLMPNSMYPLIELPRNILKMVKQGQLGARKRFLINKLQTFNLGAGLTTLYENFLVVIQNSQRYYAAQNDSGRIVGNISKEQYLSDIAQIESSTLGKENATQRKRLQQMGEKILANQKQQEQILNITKLHDDLSLLSLIDRYNKEADKSRATAYKRRTLRSEVQDLIFV